jgi:hypothetical protein
VKLPPAHFDKFYDVMKSEIQAMKQNPAWRNAYPNDSDATAFGKELHRRMAPLMNGNGRWLADVYVDVSTRTVRHVGPNPPGNLTNDPNVQQVDFVHMAEGQNAFAANDAWDLNRIDSFQDLKATADGALVGAQRARYLSLDANSKKLYTAIPPEVYRNGQFVRNDKHDARVFTYAFLGLASTGVIGVALYGSTEQFDDLMSQFRKVVARSTIQPGSTRPWYEQSAENRDQKLMDMEALGDLMATFLSDSLVDADAADLIRIAVTYQAMHAYLNSLGD